MKNYEKYAEKIREYNGCNFCTEFIVPYVLKSDDCFNNCSRCGMLQMIWRLEEYEEPEIDWNEVKVDTPILVRFKEDKEWVKRHFAKYENGFVYAWKDSHTSWTSLHDDDVTIWRYAKLAKDEEECKEPEVDWNEVKIDTLIMVKDSENGDWFKRYFAEYKNGKIYTWDNGHTSWETSRMIGWKYAKLVENEE